MSAAVLDADRPRTSAAVSPPSLATLVRGPDRALLVKALQTAGIAVSPGPEDAVLADAEALAVGQAVAAAGVVLTELRPAGGEGLEDLFRSLTGHAGAGQQVQEVLA